MEKQQGSFIILCRLLDEDILKFYLAKIFNLL